MTPAASSTRAEMTPAELKQSFRQTADLKSLVTVAETSVPLNNSTNASNTLSHGPIFIGFGSGTIPTAELRLLADDQIPNDAYLSVRWDGELNLNGKTVQQSGSQLGMTLRLNSTLQQAIRPNWGGR